MRTHYSNCLVAAIMAKLRNHSVKIHRARIPMRYGLHFYWVEQGAKYHFTTDDSLGWMKKIWFRGEVKKVTKLDDKGFGWC